jgi:hypothetical protein
VILAWVPNSFSIERRRILHVAARRQGKTTEIPPGDAPKHDIEKGKQRLDFSLELHSVFV